MIVVVMITVPLLVHLAVRMMANNMRDVDGSWCALVRWFAGFALLCIVFVIVMRATNDLNLYR